MTTSWIVTFVSVFVIALGGIIFGLCLKRPEE